MREGLGVGSALRTPTAAAATAAWLLVVAAVLLPVCEVGVEGGGVGGRALEAKWSKPAVGCC